MCVQKLVTVLASEVQKQAALGIDLANFLLSCALIIIFLLLCALIIFNFKNVNIKANNSIEYTFLCSLTILPLLYLS